MHGHLPIIFRHLYKNQMSALLISHAVRAFATSLVTIFIPLFLLNLGYSLLAVAIYLLINISLYAPLYYVMYKIAARIGIKKIMILSTPVQILYFIGLQQIEKLAFASDIVILGCLGALLALAETMYYTGYHVDIAKSTTSKTNTKAIGRLDAVSSLLAAIAPLLGAILITRTGFGLTFSVVAILFIISSLPLLFTKEIHEKFQFRWRDIVRKKNEGLFTPFFSEGAHLFAMMLIWPIYFYFVFSTYENVGLIYSVASVTAILTSFVASKYLNKKNKTKALRVGAILRSAFLLVKLSIRSIGTMIPVEIGSSVTNATTRISYLAHTYELSKKKGIMNTLFIREFYLNIGRTILILILIVLLGYMNDASAIFVLLIITSIAALGMGAITKKKLYKKEKI